LVNGTNGIELGLKRRDDCLLPVECVVLVGGSVRLRQMSVHDPDPYPIWVMHLIALPVIVFLEREEV
jgi:hypothetical protein